MSRRISQSITPTTEDISALRSPFVTKGASDPVITELRGYLKDSVPGWLAKLSETQELTRDRLVEITDAVDKRRAVYEALPEGEARDKALAALDRTQTIVDEMDTELSGANAFSGIN